MRARRWNPSCSRSRPGPCAAQIAGARTAFLDAVKRTSGIPRSAIVGWVTFKGQRVVDIDGTNHRRLDSMQNRIDWDKDYTIKSNPDYVA